MKNYQELLNKVLTQGSLKNPARPGMPTTKELFCEKLEFDLQEGFPLLTTKKMYFKGILIELLWFLKGDTNIKYLVDNGCNIWNDDAYKYYRRNVENLNVDLNSTFHNMNKEYFLYNIRNNSLINFPNGYTLGDLGNIYGKQWRNFNGFDQIANLIANLKCDPNSRYHIVNAWNPNDFLETPQNAALPACHMLFQCSIRDNTYLDLAMTQRSCDLFLGVPFNIASYALLIHILCHYTGYLPGKLHWVGNSVHLYENHIDAVKEQLTREPLGLPRLILNIQDESIEELSIDNFILENYNSHSSIKAPLSVGI